MAIVLFILTLLIGRFVLPLAAQRETRQWQQVAEEGARIQAALMGYAVLHGVLPCPDMAVSGADAGVAPSSCPGAGEGWLPHKTLGLVTGEDPWGRRWRYRADSHFANPSAIITLSLGFADSLQVSNLEGEKLTTEEERPVAVFFSYGPNGQADGQNAVANGSYQFAPPAADFDDALFWLARPLLFHHLVTADRVR
jgi:hypothetical protein